MPTITTTVKQVHGLSLYIGGVEVNEDGVKNTLWLTTPRTRKDDAYRDADELKNNMEVENARRNMLFM